MMSLFEAVTTKPLALLERVGEIKNDFVNVHVCLAVS